ncbi:MAG: hypothetical protein QOE49_3618 [Rhodospirillaceae bacterium]|jgi:hypothetical protein|nr:hypothetical protein [Rhodospirillaceae bacterium]
MILRSACGFGRTFSIAEQDTNLWVCDKATGELLAEIPVGSNASGAPMTYQLDGRQRPYERARALITAVTTTIKAKPASIKRLLSTASRSGLPSK